MDIQAKELIHNMTSTVIMGDLVQSQRAVSTRALHTLFNDQIVSANTTFKGALLSPLTITLGDEFQGIVRSAKQAAEMARHMRLAMIASGLSCRFVVGLVALQTPLNQQNAWNMMGPGLAEARKALNNKEKGVFYRFSLPHLPITEQMLNALGTGISVIEEGWKDQQREDITQLVNQRSALEIAEERQVSRSAIYINTGAGHYKAYTTQWDAIFQTLSAIETHDLETDAIETFGIETGAEPC